MTVAEATTIKTKPKIFVDGNPYQWCNTYKFIYNTTYKRKHTYSDYEIQERLEQIKK